MRRCSIRGETAADEGEEGAAGGQAHEMERYFLRKIAIYRAEAERRAAAAAAERDEANERLARALTENKLQERTIRQLTAQNALYKETIRRGPQ